MINQVTVESSNLDLVGFQANTVFVKFKNGGCYAYAGVDRHIYQNMVTAESVGKFFNESVKKVFPCTKLEYDPFAVS